MGSEEQADAERRFGPFASEAEARAAAASLGIRPLGGPDPLAAGNQRMLLDACTAAGVQIGAYDVRILEWLAQWEPATCAVIAGLITRASRPDQPR